MNIYMTKPSIDRIRQGDNSVCVKIEFRGYEISIAADDNGGTLDDLSRTEIRIFKNDKDVTEGIVQPTACFGVLNTSEDLFLIMSELARRITKREI